MSSIVTLKLKKKNEAHTHRNKSLLCASMKLIENKHWFFFLLPARIELNWKYSFKRLVVCQEFLIIIKVFTKQIPLETTYHFSLFIFILCQFLFRLSDQAKWRKKYRFKFKKITALHVPLTFLWFGSCYELFFIFSITASCLCGFSSSFISFCETCICLLLRNE